MKDIKLGLQLGYWIWSADECAGADRRSRALGIRLDLDSRVLRFRRPHPSRLVGVPDREGAPGNLHLPAIGSHPHCYGHGCSHPRPSVRWPVRPRPRRFGSPGRRRLVRPVVREAAGHRRDHRRLARPHARHRARRPLPPPGRSTPTARRRHDILESWIMLLRELWPELTASDAKSLMLTILPTVGQLVDSRPTTGLPVERTVSIVRAFLLRTHQTPQEKP
jgi:hypothetical protein